jgi:predicted lipoprotein with Yx(FWY)xxD motif
MSVPAFAAQHGVMTPKPHIAKSGVLVAAKGMTLYTYDNDKSDKSTCYGRCAAIWLPALGSESALKQSNQRLKEGGVVGLAPRRDGSMQWTYDGKPLYLYAKDHAPGDESGDGVRGAWHAAKPSP